MSAQPEYETLEFVGRPIDGRLQSTPIRFSATFASFAKAFVQAQRQIETIRKNANNPAYNKMYADLGSVLDAILPALNSCGIGLIQSPSATYDGACTVTVVTMLLHESGEWASSSLDLRPSKSDPQGVGNATTYGRRYAALAICGVAPEDDDGNGASGGANKQNANGRASTSAPPSTPASPPDENAAIADARARLAEKQKELGVSDGDVKAIFTEKFPAKSQAQRSASDYMNVRAEMIRRDHAAKAEIAKSEGALRKPPLSVVPPTTSVSKTEADQLQGESEIKAALKAAIAKWPAANKGELALQISQYTRDVELLDDDQAQMALASLSKYAPKPEYASAKL